MCHRNIAIVDVRPDSKYASVSYVNQRRISIYIKFCFRFNVRLFCKSTEAVSADRQILGKTPRKNCYGTHCLWVLRLMQKNVGHIEGTSYTFSSKLLAYFRKVVLRDTVGDFHVDSYEVSLKEFGMSARACESINSFDISLL